MVVSGHGVTSTHKACVLWNRREAAYGTDSISSSHARDRWRAAVDIDIPPPGQSAADIIRHQWRTMLIIGAVDRGKAHTVSFSVSGSWWRVLGGGGGCRCWAEKYWPASDDHAGVRGCATLAEVATALYFVGAVSPVGHLLPMVIRHAAARREYAAFVLVNTTGLVTR